MIAPNRRARPVAPAPDVEPVESVESVVDRYERHREDCCAGLPSPRSSSPRLTLDEITATCTCVNVIAQRLSELPLDEVLREITQVLARLEDVEAPFRPILTRQCGKIAALRRAVAEIEAHTSDRPGGLAATPTT